MRHIHVTGLVLILGSALFLIGAGLPPDPRRVFSAPLKEHLAILHANRARWHAMNSLMTAGIVATAAGLFLFAAVLAGSTRALGAAVGYLIGGVLWIVALAFRDTVMLSVAEEVDETGEVPGWLEPMQAWTGRMFWLYMALAYLALALFGWTLVSTHLLAEWVGWFALVYGVVLGLAFMAGVPKTKMWGPVAEPPFLIHIPTLTLGIALLAR